LLSGTYAGSVHDKRICDEESYTFPPGCVLFKGTGFQGYEPDHIETYQPKKKPLFLWLRGVGRKLSFAAAVRQCETVDISMRTTRPAIEDGFVRPR
jgi:hypothetical protein